MVLVDGMNERQSVEANGERRHHSDKSAVAASSKSHGDKNGSASCGSGSCIVNTIVSLNNHNVHGTTRYSLKRCSTDSDLRDASSSVLKLTPLQRQRAMVAGKDEESGLATGSKVGGQSERVQWSSPVEFMLTCIGFSVGLGNVWRFPYLCYINGGGAFLIPYVIMMMFIGIPLLFMEYGMGQYFGIGSLSIFKHVCPLFQGVGVGYSILNSLVCIYYNVIIALALYYLFGSLSSTLPWSTCDNPWNTANCGDPEKCTSLALDFNETQHGQDVPINCTLATNATSHRTSPSDEFFRFAVMAEQEDSDIGNLGAVQWKLCLCLLLAWILVALIVCKGIKSSGKVAYFTATFPYIMLTVLVVRGSTLEGAVDGILYFIVPDFEKLLSPDVWFQAATQLFYANNLAWGGMITMASYNTYHHNCYRDAIVINFISFGTSLYAGIAVFSIIGYMANEYQIPINEVIKSGPGLAFIAYPRALSMMPLAQLWSALFFFMLFLLGIGSLMVGVETIMTGIMDTWHILVRHWQYRIVAIITVCTIGFLCGIPLTTQGGMYVLQLMDHYSAGFCVLIIAIIECVVINWIYGAERMSGHIEDMVGHRIPRYWQICWKYICPLLILLILIFSFIRYKPVEYGSKSYPAWAETLGWMLSLASIIPIVVVALIIFSRASGATCKQKLASVTAARADSNSNQRQAERLNNSHDEKAEISERLSNDEQKELQRISFQDFSKFNRDTDL